MSLQFPLSVLYTQVTVFRTGLPRPGLLWDDQHVAQGFAWDEETVSFGVPDHDGPCWIDVDHSQHPVELHEQALWSVAVPFRAKGISVDVGTIGIARQFMLPPGLYQLTFDALPGQSRDGETYAYTFLLRFHADNAADFQIRRQGTELLTNQVLRRDAKRA